jgi:hypothetical protein
VHHPRRRVLRALPRQPRHQSRHRQAAPAGTRPAALPGHQDRRVRRSPTATDHLHRRTAAPLPPTAGRPREGRRRLARHQHDLHDPLRTAGRTPQLQPLLRQPHRPRSASEKSPSTTPAAPAVHCWSTWTCTPGSRWRSCGTRTSRSRWRSTARSRPSRPVRPCGGSAKALINEPLLYFVAVQDQKWPPGRFRMASDLRRDGRIRTDDPLTPSFTTILSRHARTD